MRQKRYHVLVPKYAIFLIWAACFLFLAAWPASASATWGVIAVPRIRYGGGGDWYTGPTSIPNLLRAAAERIGLPTQPEHIVLRISDPKLFSYPMLYLVGHGNVRFDDQEVNRLTTWLDNGGFLWINDTYGMDRYIRREIRRLYPDKELTPLPPDHPIYHQVYEFPDGLPKIHKHDGKPPQGYGIFSRGRLVIFYTYESDVGDGIEDEGIHPAQTPEIREKAIRMAINILVFALSQ